MQENQNIEFKESWRDEYLKWICGFANAKGGKIYIGIDDDGNVVGVDNARKLMEDIPNKVRDVLGIMVDVNLLNKEGKDVIEIITEPYRMPVNYKGQYHFRSGSTKQELKGAALDHFLLEKVGRTWDSMPVAHLKADELTNAITRFRRLASKSGRVTYEDLNESGEVLLDRLRLVDDATGRLKRAAAILFYPDPERFVTGAFVKIGFFNDNADIVYQDEINGDLFTQIYKTMDVLTTKYLRAMITYDGIQRIERFPVPLSAIRETLLNALAHKNYATGTPVQIRVYDDKIVIGNTAQLPLGWTVENLIGNHVSIPFNPDIARVLFRSGEIEQWGRGINNVIKACQIADVNVPVYHFDGSSLCVVFNFTEEYKKRMNGPQSEPQNKSGETGQKTGQKNGQKMSGEQVEHQRDNKNKSDKSKTENRKEKRQKSDRKIFIRRQEIVALIRIHPDITQNEMASRLRIARSTLSNDIKYLQECGMIFRVGPDRGGHWQVVDSDKSK